MEDWGEFGLPTSKNEQKQDRSSFVVYLSVNDCNSKSNKMKPIEKRKFKDFSRTSTVFCKIQGLLRPQILETEI